MTTHSGRGDLLPVILASATGGGEESLADAAGTACVDVAVQAWRVVLLAVRDLGARLDWIGGVDVDEGATDVVALVFDDVDSVLVRTRLGPGESLPSVADVFPGADWHERETAEMLGVAFVGGDDRPLLLSPGYPAHPLRRDVALVARVSTPWPGAAEKGRRARTPGVDPRWLQP